MSVFCRAATHNDRADWLMKVLLNGFETRQSCSKSIGNRYLTICPNVSKLGVSSGVGLLYFKNHVERNVHELEAGLPARLMLR